MVEAKGINTNIVKSVGIFWPYNTPLLFVKNTPCSLSFQ